MNAKKIKVTVIAEMLSIDCARYLLMEAMNQISDEKTSGALNMDDGDCVSWTTEETPVEF